MTSTLLARLTAVLRKYDLGVYSTDDLRSEMFHQFTRAAESNDEDLPSAILEYTRAALDTNRPALEQAQLLRGIPVPLITRAWIYQVIAATPPAELIDVFVILFAPIRHHEGATGAYRIMAEPFLETATTEGVSLLSLCYRKLTPGPRELLSLRESLLAHDWLVTPGDLLAIAIRDSIESRHSDAATIARRAIDRELPHSQLPLAALVLWISGNRDEARALLPTIEVDEFGWFGQAAETVRDYLEAVDATPERQLELLAAQPSEGLIRHPATVGALVGRAAYLRMRAHAQLGERDESAREAHAVVASHAYRGYDLHLQVEDGEFDVRLVEPLAVRADELAAARELIAANPQVEAPRWLIMEGRLIREL